MSKWLSISNLYFWSVIFVLLFIPLYPKFPLINIAGTFVAIRIEDLLILLLSLFWFSRLLIEKKIAGILNDKLIQAILLFLGVGIVSLFSGIFITHTVIPHLGLFHFLRRIEFLILLPIAYMAISNKKQLKISLFLLLVATLVINIYALGQEYLDWPVISTTNSEFAKGQILRLTPEARVNSTFAGHYDLAIYLMGFLVVLSSLFFIQKWKIKIVSALIGGLSFLVLVMTAARVSFLAAVIGIIVALLLTGKKWVVLGVILVTILALIYPSQLRDRMVSTVTVNLLGQGDRFVTQNKIQDTQSRLNIPTLQVKYATRSAMFGYPKDSSSSATGSSEIASDITPGEPTDSTELGVYRSFSIRINQEWPRAIRAFWKNPLLGTGYSSLGIATDNDFLRSIGEVGILGTVAFGLIFIELSKRFWVLRKSNDRLVRYLASGMLALILAVLLNATFIDVFESSKVASLFWMVLGMTLATHKYDQ